jgi:hypothetical protein
MDDLEDDKISNVLVNNNPQDEDRMDDLEDDKISNVLVNNNPDQYIAYLVIL